MNQFRVTSCQKVSEKFPSLIKSKFVGKTLGEILQLLDSEHPITIFNFYSTSVGNMSDNPDKPLSKVRETLTQYVKDEIDFQELRENSKVALSVLYETCEEYEWLSCIPFPDTNIEKGQTVNVFD